MCVTGVRQARSLSQEGFELANGLPFVVTDKAIHELLNAYTVAEAQTFFCLDTFNKQPLCFTTGTASKTVSQATPELLDLASAILSPQQNKSLVVADGEHFTVDVINDTHNRSHFDLLVQLPNQPALKKKLKNIPHEQFVSGWAGFATHKSLYSPTQATAGRTNCPMGCQTSCKIPLQRPGRRYTCNG